MRNYVKYRKWSTRVNNSCSKFIAKDLSSVRSLTLLLYLFNSLYKNTKLKIRNKNLQCSRQLRVIALFVAIFLIYKFILDVQRMKAVRNRRTSKLASAILLHDIAGSKTFRPRSWIKVARQVNFQRLMKFQQSLLYANRCAVADGNERIRKFFSF